MSATATDRRLRQRDPRRPEQLVRESVDAAECHSVGEGGLKHWLNLYQGLAKSSCKLNTPIEGMDRSTGP